MFSKQAILPDPYVAVRLARGMKQFLSPYQDLYPLTCNKILTVSRHGYMEINFCSSQLFKIYKKFVPVTLSVKNFKCSTVNLWAGQSLCPTGSQIRSSTKTITQNWHCFIAFWPEFWEDNCTFIQFTYMIQRKCVLYPGFLLFGNGSTNDLVKSEEKQIKSFKLF